MKGTGRLTFRPPLWATLALIAAAALFIRAGFWQLGRADEKRALFADFESAQVDKVLTGPVADAEVTALRFRQVQLTGRYDTHHQVLLDSLVHDGQVGYQVLTPLRTADGAVLINRGWIPADRDRQRLPALPVDDGERQVTGRLDRLPRPGLLLAAAEPPGDAPWPRRLLFPTAAEISAQLGYPVRDYQVLLDPADADGYTREWRPAVMPPQTHFGYAVQWFSFAAALGVIYLVLNVKRQADV